jgi:hypothetical protein
VVARISNAENHTIKNLWTKKDTNNNKTENTKIGTAEADTKIRGLQFNRSLTHDAYGAG